MLDTETKRRIDNARDILVGKVPDPKSQVEQITIALIYKFMDDMDNESVELGGSASYFTGKFKKYAWTNLMSKKLGGIEVLNLYTEGLDLMVTNTNLPQLFRDIFKNAYLPYRDPETLKSFLKIIDDFRYDSSENLGDAFEYLLSVLGSQGKAGQFRTPRHIIDFIFDIIDPKKDETILDPACGTAGFLISSFKHILKHNSKNYKPESDLKVYERKDSDALLLTVNDTKYTGDKLTPDQREKLAKNIRGYDISPDMVRLSLVNMYLHSISNPLIFEYDTLTSEDKWNEYSDVILANPPFMSPTGGIKPHKRFSVQSKRSEVLFVDYIAEHLTPNGRAAIIVPEGIIFQSQNSYKQLRKMLVENYLVAVVSLPAGVFNPYSGVKTSVLFLDKALAKKTKDILFVKVENDGFDLGAQRRAIDKNDLPGSAKFITKYIETVGAHGNVPIQNIPKNALIVSKEKLAENSEYNLSGERYNDNISQKNNIWELVELEKLCEFKNGLWTGKKPPFIKINVIRNTNFDKNGKLNLSNVAELDVEAKQFESRNLIQGDIILEKSGGGPTQPVGRVVLFNIDSTNYSFSNFTSVIRIINSDKLDSFYLWAMLNDLYEKGYTDKLQKRTSGIRNLDFGQYKQLQIPLPPLEVQKEIVAEIEGYQKIIDGARQVVENYKPHIDIDPSWPVVKLGDVCENLDGKRIPITKSDRENGIYPYYGASGIVDYVKGYIFDGNYLLVSEDGANLLARVTPIAFSVSGKFWVNNHAHILKFKDYKSQVFVEYYLNSIPLKHYITGSAQPKLNQNALNSINIPYPEIDKQTEIVNSIEIEQSIVNANKELIKLYEEKIKKVIARVWGEK